MKIMNYVINLKRYLKSFVSSFHDLIGSPRRLAWGEESRKNDWIIRSRGCVIIALECKFVILNEVKNLIRSMCYKTEILRLGPQNDIATQPPSRIMTTIGKEFSMKYETLKQGAQ